MNVIRTPLAAAAAVMFALPAFADPLSTDRPDFVESSLTVGAGTFQIETSVAMARREGFGQRPRELSTPTLLRLGIGEQWEARLETDGVIQMRSEASAPAAEGFGDLALGVKYHVAAAGPGDASMAWLVHVDLPSGSREFRGRDARPSLRGIAEWELPHGLSLGLMPGIAYSEDADGQDYLSGIAGLTVGIPLLPKLRGFVELASEELGSAGHAETQFSFDTGLIWQLTDNLQLDTAAYAGLNRSTPDITVAVGLSARW